MQSGEWNFGREVGAGGEAGYAVIQPSRLRQKSKLGSAIGPEMVATAGVP